MSVLFERWPTLQGLPRVELATLPTPVHALPRVSRRMDADVWVKRDDATGLRYGGNKLRKLEFLLGEARAHGVDTLITLGAAGSHHVFATALYAGELGFDVHAVLTPQPFHAGLEGQLRADLAVGAHLYPASSLAAALRKVAQLAITMRLKLRHPAILPIGGSTTTGALGYVNAGLELAQQVEAGECPDPDAVYVACGSCATAAGLAVGLCAGGVRTRVFAVRVVDHWLGNRLNLTRLVRDVVARLRALDPRFPDVTESALSSLELRHDQVGRGYGLPTPESDAATHLARAEALLTLDPTYTSKAFAALLHDAEGGRRGQHLLYWHTLSSAPLEPFEVGAPMLPEALARLIRS